YWAIHSRTCLVTEKGEGAYNRCMYTPSQKILEKYAHTLVNFALNGGEGLRPGEVVFLSSPEIAKPLFVALRRVITQAGGHIIADYHPSPDENFNPGRDFFELANEEQINFFPNTYRRGLIDQIDHQLMIIADTDKHELAGIDPKKIMAKGIANKPYMEWRDAKESQGKFSWTLALYGTEASAKEA